MSKRKLAAIMILSGGWLVALGCSLLPNVFSSISWGSLNLGGG